MEQVKLWRDYERIITAVESENKDIELSITRNARIRGCISRAIRQIDVLIDTRWDNDVSKRIIIDAKYYKRKLHIKDIEAFEGMLKDCRASRGIIYCPNGYSKAAQRRAQGSIQIKILSSQELEEPWRLRFEKCYSKRCQHKNSKRGLVLWDAQHPLSVDNSWSVIFTGKCDACGDFNVWCWECGEKFGISVDDTYTCSCERMWACLEGEEENVITHYLCMLLNGKLLTFDRKILS